MLAKDDMIADIRKGLASLQAYIQPGGKLNLTDANVHAEDFILLLLNAVFGWSLTNINVATSNFPGIDLIDQARKLGVQVTSEEGSKKLNDTLERLVKNKLAGKITELKFLSLIRKQDRYTVNSSAPGIAFDWKTDVLDFADVLKATKAISDLEHLRRVHCCVTDSMPSLFPEYSSRRIPLVLPKTEPAKAWLVYSSRATTLVGRDTDRAELTKFLNNPARFSWWMVTGPAGSGKSRLALELCYQASTEWHSGFLSRTATDFKWSHFAPTRKTLIVIDYVASRAAEIGEAILELARSKFTYPVRLLLIEREQGSWWSKVIREDSHSEMAEIKKWQFSDSHDISKMTLEAILSLAEEVVKARGGKWDREAAEEFLTHLCQYDPKGRPLFAMIVANYLDGAGTDGSPSNLLHEVLVRETGRRRKLASNGQDFQRLENLLLLATLTGGLVPKEKSFDYLANSGAYPLLPDFNTWDSSQYKDYSGASVAGDLFAGLQPDVLGERFALDRLAAAGIAGMNARKLLLAAWAFQPKDVRVFAVRAAYDFSGDQALASLFDLPLESSEERAIWAEMVSDFIAVTGNQVNEFTFDQLQKLITIADKYPEEQPLQEATANADYNMGRDLMFQDGAKEFSIQQFDNVVKRIGDKPLIAKMAIHNRGILSHHDSDNHSALSAYSMMIDFPDAPDEMKACALNNRADIYAEKQEHKLAIRDRTYALALKDTLPDRRYIALFRRSQSYIATGDDASALADLEQIVKTWDISPKQKGEARLEQAFLLRRLGRTSDAEKQLELVVTAKRLFAGCRAAAMVELADLLLPSGDAPRAVRYLEQAIADPQARAETRIDAAVIRARIYEKDDEPESALELWRQILACPNLPPGYRDLAQSRIDASTDSPADS